MKQQGFNTPQKMCADQAISTENKYFAEIQSDDEEEQFLDLSDASLNNFRFVLTSMMKNYKYMFDNKDEIWCGVSTLSVLFSLCLQYFIPISNEELAPAPSN